MNKQDTRPILLSESTTSSIPVHLESILHGLNTGSFSSVQDCRVSILATLIYYVGLETGFIPTKEGRVDESQSIPIKKQKYNEKILWGFNRMNLQNQSLNLLQNRNQSYFRQKMLLENSTTEFTLLMLRSGEDLMTTLTSEGFPGKKTIYKINDCRSHKIRLAFRWKFAIINLKICSIFEQIEFTVLIS